MGTTMTATRIDRGSTPTTTIYSEGGDLVFERTFDAPRERVWKAFTDPEIVPRWWGRHGTTTTVAEMDVRPGGKWRYISSAPDRDDVAFYGEYLRSRRPRASSGRSCSTSRASARRAARRAHRFEDLGGKTKVSLDRAHGVARDPRGRAGDRDGRRRDRDLGPAGGAARRRLTTVDPRTSRASHRGVPGLLLCLAVSRRPRFSRRGRRRSPTSGRSRPGRPATRRA